LGFFLPKKSAFASVCVTFDLKRLNMGASSYPFRKATLNNCDGSLQGRWYIVFYVWDVQQCKMVRKRDYSLNIYATAAQRRAFAKERIQSINDLLMDGYHIDSRKKSEYEPDAGQGITLDKAVRDILEKFKATLRISLIKVLPKSSSNGPGRTGLPTRMCLGLTV
jgi:hypothetical protein